MSEQHCEVIALTSDVPSTVHHAAQSVVDKNIRSYEQHSGKDIEATVSTAHTDTSIYQVELSCERGVAVGDGAIRLALRDTPVDLHGWIAHANGNATLLLEYNDTTEEQIAEASRQLSEVRSELTETHGEPVAVLPSMTVWADDHHNEYGDIANWMLNNMQVNVSTRDISEWMHEQARGVDYSWSYSNPVVMLTD